MMEQRKFNSDDLDSIISELKSRNSELKYTGDISDLGNEIGYIIGKHYTDFTQEDIVNFIHGFEHGISLTNGTH